MGTQTYIPADQADGTPTPDIEAMLRVPLAIAETGISKVRTFLIINIINTLWIGYFYKSHTDASLLWMIPVFLVLTLIIVHQWFLYFALRDLLKLPGRMNNLSREAGTKATDFFQQNEAVFSRMQGNGMQLTGAASMFDAFSDVRNMSSEFQEMMSAVIRALFLGNPIILGLSIGVSSLMLLVGCILLIIHVV